MDFIMKGVTTNASQKSHKIWLPWFLMEKRINSMFKFQG